MKRSSILNIGITLLLTTVMVLPSVLAMATWDMTIEPRDHQLVSVNDAGTIQDLKEANVEILEDYGSFVLVNARPSSLEGFDVMVTQYDLDTIDLQRITFDPSKGDPVLAEGYGLGKDGYGERGHYIVQFYGPVKEPWKEALLRHGAFIDDYLPNDAFIVGMDVGTKEIVTKEPFVQWIGLYQPIYKVQPTLDGFKGYLDVQVILFDDMDLDATIAEISALGDIKFVDTTTHIKIGLTIYSQNILSLARIDAVKWIEHAPVWVPYSSTATWIEQSMVQDSTPLYDHGLHGENQTIFNSDTGITVAHEAYHDASKSVQFSDPSANPGPDNTHRKVKNYWTFADNSDSGASNYHGTHTNGVIAGLATPNGGTFKGIAHEAKISFADIFYNSGGNAIPSNLNTLFQKGANDGAHLASDSWGMWGSWGIYDSQAQEADEFMWNNKDFLILYSAGNDGSGAGSVSTPSTAKNVMAVGAAELSVAGNMKGYSSRGPTDDGRLKPTLYTPTDEIGPCGGGSCGTTTYASAGGTSNSCPAAAGGMALLRQYYTDGFYPSGTKKASDSFSPSAALMTATAINGAVETNGQNAHDHPYNSMMYPNNDQGWGYMNQDNALYFDGDSKKLYIDDHTTGLSTGENVEYYVSVKDSSIPLKVMIAWTDYKGTTGANTELVNNLDLTVEAPGGAIYKGNVFRTSGSPHESIVGGAADAKNVEEGFLLMNPPTGGYNIKVTATNVAQGTQPFAMVSTGDFVRDPDLAVLRSEIIVEPIGLTTEGDSVWFNGTVHNYGGLVGNLVPMDYYVDDVKVDSQNFDLSLSDLASFSFNWVAEAGFHDFKFVLDPADIVTEADESNNEATVSLWANGLPRANVTYSPSDPMTKDLVTFDATGSVDDGGITWYMFDFGDGSKTNWVKVGSSTHIYDDDGVYNISVWVKDNMSIVSEPAMTQVTIQNQVPSANATAAVMEAYTFFDISFDASRSRDPDGTITYQWDFDDGTTSLDDRPTHNWSDDGLYNIKMTVTDDDGATNSTTLPINILNQLPTVYFDVDQYIGNVTTPFKFNATAWDKDGEISEWVWDLGDGNTSDEEDLTYYYSDDGEYTVMLYAVDDDGGMSNMMNSTITINNLPPTANMTASSMEVKTLEEIRFTDLSEDIDGHIISYNWRTGDGKFYTNENPVHTYQQNGLFKVSLTVQDDDGDTGSFEILIKVRNRLPVAKAIFNQTAYVGDLVTFSGNQSEDMDGELIRYEWGFNASDPTVGKTVTNAFWDPGVHNFTLVVTDDDGGTDSINLSIMIEKKPEPPPVIDLGSGLGGLFGLLLLVIVIGALVGALIMGSRYRKKKRAGSTPYDKGLVNRVATDPPRTQDGAGPARTMDGEFTGLYQYQAYDTNVESHPHYGEEVVNQPYDSYSDPNHSDAFFDKDLK